MNTYYPVSFKYCNKFLYFIWVSSNDNDFFFNKNRKILSFKSIESLKYFSKKKFYLESDLSNFEFDKSEIKLHKNDFNIILKHLCILKDFENSISCKDDLLFISNESYNYLFESISNLVIWKSSEGEKRKLVSELISYINDQSIQEKMNSFLDCIFQRGSPWIKLIH